MEAYELQNMELGVESAVYRFFTLHVLTPAMGAINAMDSVYEDSANANMVGGYINHLIHTCTHSYVCCTSCRRRQ